MAAGIIRIFLNMCSVPSCCLNSQTTDEPSASMRLVKLASLA